MYILYNIHRSNKRTLLSFFLSYDVRQNDLWFTNRDSDCMKWRLSISPYQRERVVDYENNESVANKVTRLEHGEQH